ncbi:hypothetical protein GCM10025868_44520 [Angustibacter aerolatus]|uniref:thiosulfate sulfurtransferase n=1 Tax=Angustibacter aerolatus TaxID=1162965 RepID=A0ABQ6JLQ0_9ACTN|nr:rhodanese-like domain-containing protein [Angustibacter aerolatus]GMA89202.1 hypothetical protein GCM10025868_44520 [Angustibacter aerolatus]
MTLPQDTDPKLAEYAHPERLVTTQWLADHLGDDGLVVVESDEDVLLYDTGHVPGAVKVDWHVDLNDPVTRDYVDGERFAQVMGERGIGRDTTVVVYGDKNNWWAAYALWVFSLFGHEDVRLLDGGRAKWVAEERETTRETPTPTPVEYPVVERDDSAIRAFKDDVLAHLGGRLVDVRSPGEFSGSLLHMPDYPQEGAMRGGHVPGASSVPWARAAAEDGTFRGRSEPGGHLPGREGSRAVRRRDRLLPHRRALVAHLVRADAPARLRARAQLRRLVDGVGQLGARAHRDRARAVTTPTDADAALPEALAEPGGRLHLRHRARPPAPAARA